MQVRILNRSHHPLPTHATAGAAGVDLSANLTAPVELAPMGRALIPTGLWLEIPTGYEVQIRPRSGLALKNGITLLNSPATIDSDYRGELQVLLINLSNESFTVTDGMRIAQLLVAQVLPLEWELVQSLTPTDRGAGGFGHTGH